MLKIIITFMCINLLFAETSLEEFQTENIAKELKNKVGKLYKLKDVTKFGYVDKTGKWVVPPKFVDIGNFDKNGYALATIKGRLNGECLSFFDRRRDECNPPVKDGKYGFINVNAEWIVESKYDKLEEFTNSHASAVINGKSGFIDRKGGWHDTIKNIKQPSKEQLCKNEVLRNGNYVYTEEENKIVAVDKSCKPIAYFENSIVAIPRLYAESRKGLIEDVKIQKFGIWDTAKHGWKIEPIFQLEDAQYFDFFAKKDGKWGQLSEDGNWKIKPQFHKLESFEDDGLARAKNMNYKWGLIDQKGKWVIEPIFDEIGSLGDNGLRAAKKEYKGKYGYIDNTGKYYIDEKFDKARDFRRGYAEVENEKKCGYIDGHGKVIIDIQYDKCETEGANFLLTIGNKKGLLDKDNNWILKPLFDNIDVIDEHMIKVEYGNYEGYTDITGKPLTFTMDEVKNVVNSK